MKTPVPLPRLFDLSGQAAVVTGAAKGIGKGIAERLAEAGAAVLLTDVDAREGEAAAAAIAANGGKAAFFRADSASVADARKTVDVAVEKFGRIDILVNNAGVFPGSPMLETTEEIWDRTLDINLKGAFFLSQAAAKRMVEARTGGSIVNIASIDAYHPTGGLVHYDASKGGMVMMTRSMAVELGRFGVRVNGVAPGAIRTPGADEAGARIAKALGLTGEQMMGGFLQKIPLGRQGTPDDIATAVLFLVTPAGEYVTGQTIVVDGGFLVG
jgi:NAD(P)-dependent dehydrogenase (short-subunit alcohol dehydrogenase family)